MKKNIREKIKRFLTSEVGQTSLRAPLVLGVAGGAVLLSQVVHTPPAEAALECTSHNDCETGYVCAFWCEDISYGTCVEWSSACI